MSDTLVTEARSQLVSDANGVSVVREFDVIAASELDALNVLYSETGITRGTFYLNALGEVVDAFVRVQSLRVEGRPPAPLGGKGLYRVEAQYAKQLNGSTAEPTVNTAPTYEWDGQLQSEPVDLDYDGNPIVNSSGEPFDPPLSAPLPRLTGTITLYKTSLPVSTLLAYVGATNSDNPWSIGDGSGDVPRGGALITAAKVSAASNGLRQVQIGIEARPTLVINGQSFQPFRRVVHDRGRRIITGTDGDGNTTYELVRDDNGNPLPDPVLLDGAGGRLAAGSSPVLLSFKNHGEASYEALGI